jgi:BirA family biotin operon repressor/biotin-[acetyl-CoA-carboxylase] ligase
LGLFVGQNIITLKSVDSTNNYLKEILSKSKPLPEGTVILAVEQSAGRGQLGNRWHSESGKNLTFSVLLNPTFLAVEQQFELNKAVSLALNDVLSTYFGVSAKIKWPNDSYIGTQKIGGMLIENNIHGNLLKHAIIGIGLNVNQLSFPSVLKNVTSFKQILRKEHNLEHLLGEICGAIEARYLQLKAGKFKEIGAEYLNKLYLLNEWSMYRIKGKLQSGKICGVNTAGCIEVEIENQVKTYGLKEIEFI